MSGSKQPSGALDRYFHLQQYGTNVRTEILAGATTFIAIAYILILNPQILADPYVIMGDTAMAGKISNGVFIGTCIGAFIGTLLVGLYAKLPFAQAPGMGRDAFFAYTKTERWLPPGNAWGRNAPPYFAGPGVAYWKH